VVSCARLCFDTAKRYGSETVCFLWRSVWDAVSWRRVAAVVCRQAAGVGGGEEVVCVWAAVGLL